MMLNKEKFMTADNQLSEQFFKNLSEGFGEWETEMNKISGKLLRKACQPIFEKTGDSIVMFEMETPTYNDGEECVNRLGDVFSTSEEKLLEVVNAVISDRCLSISLVDKVTPEFLRKFTHVNNLYHEFSYTQNGWNMEGFHSDVKNMLEQMFNTNVLVIIFKDENEPLIVHRFEPSY